MANTIVRVVEGRTVVVAAGAEILAAYIVDAQAIVDEVEARIQAAIDNLPAEFIGPIGPTGPTSINDLPIVVAATVSDGVTDDAAVVNATLADADNSYVMLKPGTTAVDSTIRIPTGKTLLGAGKGRTTIKALATFDRLIDTNAVVASDDDADQVTVENLTIDANKVGNGMGDVERLQGIIFEGATNFAARNVHVKNASGYGILARGDPNAFTMWGNGVITDCSSENCQIHFEQMTCDGVVLTNCTAVEGDGDITCSSFFHPLTGSRNIWYIACRGVGPASSGAEMTANLAEQYNINFIGCDLDVTGGGIGIVSNGVFGTTRVNLIDSRFASSEELGANLEYSSGKIIGCRIEGAETVGSSVGLRFNAASQDHSWDVSNTDVISTPPAGAQGTGVLAEGGAKVRWSGGHIRVDTAAAGSSGNAISRGAGSSVVVSTETRLTPSGDVEGGGFTFHRTMPAGGASSSSTTGTVVANATDYVWTVPLEAGRKYKIRIRGGWVHGSTASNGRLGVQGDGTLAGTVYGDLFLNTSPTARTSKIINGIAGVGTAGSFVEAAMPSIAEYLPLGGEFVISVTVAGSLSIEIGTSNASHAMTLLGLSSFEVTEI